MHWSNWLALGVIVVSAIIQAVRGKKSESMGLLFFEFVGLVLAAVAATGLTRVIGKSVGMSETWLLIVLFVLIGVALMFLARVVANAVSWSFDSGSTLLGLFWGAALGWVLAHMVLRVIIGFQGPDGEVAIMAEQGPITREVYLFTSWNWLMKAIFNINLGPRV
jgi:hypothetical protein